MENYFYTFLISITPVLELRASIPLGILKYKIPSVEVLLLSCLGGILVTGIVLSTLPKAIELTRRHIPALIKPLDLVLNKTRSKHSKKINILGDLFLVILVAIPLPGSGAFTGSLVAYLFGIKFWKAFGLISTGIVFSGIIVMILTLSGQSLWEAFSANVAEIL